MILFDYFTTNFRW